MGFPIEWARRAEGREDVFRPKIAPQGLDGTAHFSYFDPERQLHFVWDGYYDQHVNVSYGGAGEPVLWTFDFLEIYRSTPRLTHQKSPNLMQGMWAAPSHFGWVCNRWIELSEGDLS